MPTSREIENAKKLLEAQIDDAIEYQSSAQVSNWWGTYHSEFSDKLIEELKRELADAAGRAGAKAKAIEPLYDMTDSHGLSVQRGDYILLWTNKSRGFPITDIQPYQFVSRRPWRAAGGADLVLESPHPEGSRMARIEVGWRDGGNPDVAIWRLDPEHVEHVPHYIFRDGVVSTYAVPQVVPGTIEKLMLLRQ